MKSISNWQDFVKQKNHDVKNIDVDKDILSFLKNAKVLAVSAAKVFDEIESTVTGIELVAYHSGDFAWDSRDIFYYENYGMPLKTEFIKHALSK